VVFSGYLAAVYLAADSRRRSRGAGHVVADGVVAGAGAVAGPGSGSGDGDGALADAFRRRALGAGLVCGALALAGVLVMRNSGLNLTHGFALVLVCASAASGLATLLLCWWYRFGLARVTAALAVAAVVVGWAAGQAPRLLPGLTVVQAAASRSTLVALIIAVGCGAVVLVPSLALLFTLYLRGRLDIPEHVAVGVADDGGGSDGRTVGGGGVVGSSGVGGVGGIGGVGGVGGVGGGGREAATSGIRVRAWGSAAAVGLVAGAVLLVFADANWAHLVGVACLVLCAVAVFLLVAPGDA
jgi:cytochrome bd ubiquinol oxidase subunit II